MKSLEYSILQMCYIYLEKEKDKCFFFYDFSDNQIFYITTENFKILSGKNEKEEPSRLFLNVCFILTNIVMEVVGAYLYRFVSKKFLLVLLLIYLLLVPIEMYVSIRIRKKEMERIKEKSVFVKADGSTICKLYKMGEKDRKQNISLAIIVMLCLLYGAFRLAYHKDIFWAFFFPVGTYSLFSLFIDCLPHNVHRMHKLIKRIEKERSFQFND